jgi:hypothetical protein
VPRSLFCLFVLCLEVVSWRTLQSASSGWTDSNGRCGQIYGDLTEVKGGGVERATTLTLKMIAVCTKHGKIFDTQHCWTPAAEMFRVGLLRRITKSRFRFFCSRLCRYWIIRYNNYAGPWQCIGPYDNWWLSAFFLALSRMAVSLCTTWLDVKTLHAVNLCHVFRHILTMCSDYVAGLRITDAFCP